MAARSTSTATATTAVRERLPEGLPRQVHVPRHLSQVGLLDECAGRQGGEVHPQCAEVAAALPLLRAVRAPPAGDARAPLPGRVREPAPVPPAELQPRDRLAAGLAAAHAQA